MKKNIIFLDIDGVLNSDKEGEYIGRIRGVDNEHLEKLKTICSLLDADIVLSSTWKIFWDTDLTEDGVESWKGRSKKRYGRYLNLRLEEFGLKIADKTDEIGWSLRGMEIRKWLEDHPLTENFVILDDEDFHWRDHGLQKHWIDTSSEEFLLVGEGLQDKDIETARIKLEKGDLRNAGIQTG